MVIILGSRIIHAIYGIIAAIRKEVIVNQLFALAKVCNAVGVDETTYFGIVISRLKII